MIMPKAKLLPCHKMDISFVTSRTASALTWLKELFKRKKSDGDHGMKTVLNAILLPTIGLLSMLFSFILYTTLCLKDNYDFVHTVDFACIIAGYVLLLVISHRGYVRLASYGTVALCFVGSFYCGYRWGASLPETLLCFALTMGVTNLLFGIRTSIVAMTASFVAIFYLNGHEMVHPEILSWQDGDLDMTDFMSYFSIIVFMFGLSWISRWRMAKSLARAEASERALERERDSLERRVAERTEELRLSQEEHISELASIAEFGRLSQGLFHDLLSPISSMLLHIERLSRLPSEKEIRDSKESLQKMCSAAKKFSGYLSSLRLAIGSPSTEIDCSFEEELENVFNLLAFNARSHSIHYERPDAEIGRVPHSSSDMHQILFNLISNAVDSFEDAPHTKRNVVSVKAKVQEKSLCIGIIDNGCGISPEVLPHIFDQFFTTKKPCQGLGIGLSTVQRIVKSLGGTISIESEPGNGTRVEVIIPLADPS